MQEGTRKKSPRVIVLGFDAATWDIIDPLMAKGQLPNFKAVLQDGVRATLRSLEFQASPRVWTSIVTGKTELKHGIMDFFSNVSQLKCKRIWDILHENNQSSSIFYWFMTWPPQKELNGHMVPGFLGRDSQTVPEDLSFLKELEMSGRKKILEHQKGSGIGRELDLAFRAMKKGVRLSTLIKSAFFLLEQKFKKYVELDVFSKIQFVKLDLYRDVFLYLLKHEPTDFSAILFPQADQIGHKYWAFYEADEYEKRVGIEISQKERKKYGDVIPKAYREMDKIIGQVRRIMNEDDILMIISDHGFGMIAEPQAQLKIKNNEFIDAVALNDVAHGVSIGPDFIIQVDDPEYRSRLPELAEKFEEIRVEGEAEPFFQVKTKESEIVLGLRKIWNIESKDAADLMKKNLQINGKLVRVSDVIVKRSDISGDHRPNGMLAMVGKNIKQNVELPESSVLDITPTILYLKNLAVGKDMDGSPILDAFDEEYVKNNPVEYIDTFETGERRTFDEDVDFSMTDQIEQRLKSLGYLG